MYLFKVGLDFSGVQLACYFGEEIFIYGCDVVCLAVTCTKSVGCKTMYISCCCKTFDPIFEILPYSHGLNA